MTISNNFFSRRIAQFLRLASVLILAGCALWLALRVPVIHARTGAPANPPPYLRGRGAVEHLKQEGLYDTLTEAINPLFAQEKKLTASNGAANDYFGSVAISGDTVIVGAAGGGPNEDQGAAYVFVRSGTAWNQQAILTASDGSAFDYFGGSVAIDGNTAVIGAPGAGGPNGNQGAVYVFVRSGTTWTLQQKLSVIPDGVSDGYDDQFGMSVAISGNTVTVGAPYVTIDNLLQGAAYVFVRSGTTWTLQQKLTTSGDATVIYFGWTVAVSGSTVAVAASCYDWSEGFICPDSVYVYARSGTTWPLQQRLTTSDTFGKVAISGDTLAVGAYVERAAYVFVRSGTTWTLQQKLTVPIGVNHDNFGSSVAISGNTLAVGAPYESTEGWIQYQGAAYAFTRSGTTWTLQQRLIASDRAKDDNFGSSVAVSGGTVVVGSPNADIGANRGQGAVYVFAP